MTILALWATPRTVSTAFERMVIERGDLLVLDEPWSRAYYFGPDRRSTRYPLVFPESSAAAVERGVLETASEADLFVKDMAYQAVDVVSDAALVSMRHTFLIREPAAALASLHRGWPDFTDEEAGYEAQGRLFDRIVDLGGTPPLVIDSDRLCAEPDRIVAAWCAAVGIEHRPEALSWSPGAPPQWQLWRGWYETAAASSGFTSSTRSTATPLPDRVTANLPEALRIYDRLLPHAIA